MLLVKHVVYGCRKNSTLSFCSVLEEPKHHGHHRWLESFGKIAMYVCPSWILHINFYWFFLHFHSSTARLYSPTHAPVHRPPFGRPLPCSPLGYPSAAINTKQAGECTAQFLLGMEQNNEGFKASKVHAIGFSLGAHVASFASMNTSLNLWDLLNRNIFYSIIFSLFVPLDRQRHRKVFGGQI